MVAIGNEADGSKAFHAFADGFWMTPPCDVQDIPMLSWVFTCITVGYVQSDTDTYAGTVSCTTNTNDSSNFNVKCHNNNYNVCHQIFVTQPVTSNLRGEIYMQKPLR